jgi:hypothetical protein
MDRRKAYSLHVLVESPLVVWGAVGVVGEHDEGWAHPEDGLREGLDAVVPVDELGAYEEVDRTAADRQEVGLASPEQLLGGGVLARSIGLDGGAQEVERAASGESDTRVCEDKRAPWQCGHDAKTEQPSSGAKLHNALRSALSSESGQNSAPELRKRHPSTRPQLEAGCVSRWEHASAKCEGGRGLLLHAVLEDDNRISDLQLDHSPPGSWRKVVRDVWVQDAITLQRWLALRRGGGEQSVVDRSSYP